MQLNKFFTRVKAVILDDNGTVQNTSIIDKKTLKTSVNNRAYTLINYEKASCLEIKRLFFKDYYFFFHYKDLRPLSLKYTFKSSVEIEPDTALINTILQADTLLKLNDLSRPKLFGNIDAKMVLIGLAVVGVIVYLLSGGSLT